jgi:hypothetical protein
MSNRGAQSTGTSARERPERTNQVKPRLNRNSVSHTSSTTPTARGCKTQETQRKGSRTQRLVTDSGPCKSDSSDTTRPPDGRKSHPALADWPPSAARIQRTRCRRTCPIQRPIDASELAACRTAAYPPPLQTQAKAHSRDQVRLWGVRLVELPFLNWGCTFPALGFIVGGVRSKLFTSALPFVLPALII